MVFGAVEDGKTAGALERDDGFDRVPAREGTMLRPVEKQPSKQGTSYATSLTCV